MEGMKHPLNGVAIAALIAIAGPAWAQQQTVPNPTPNPSGNTLGLPVRTRADRG
jgi:hypothetical protein